MKKAVLLLSGGIDSTTGLLWFVSKGYEIYPLFIDYGQKNRGEEERARTIVENIGCEKNQVHRLAVIKIDLDFVIDSGLTTLPIKELDRDITTIESDHAKVSTYFPARNLIFLSLALGHAEAVKAETIFIGCYPSSGVPDCSKRFMNLFEDIAQKATEAGRRGTRFKIKMFKNLRKPDIIKLGVKLGVPFELTMSCFNPNPITGEPCWRCDACCSRAYSFLEGGYIDPLVEKWKAEKD